MSEKKRQKKAGADTNKKNRAMRAKEAKSPDESRGARKKAVGRGPRG
jgi:hypothetical protein